MRRSLPAEGNNPGEGKMSYVIVYVTTKDENEARSIGERLVSEKLAACVNMIPSIESVYWWKGKIEKDKESVMMIKTKEDLVEKVISRTKELHSYDVPCIDVIPITEGNRDYFKWIQESLR